MKLEADNDFFPFLSFIHISLKQKEKKKKRNWYLIATNFLNEQHCSVVQNMYLVTFFRMFSFSVYKIMAQQKLNLVLHFSSAILPVSVLLPCLSRTKNRLVSRYFIFYSILILFFT